MQQAYLLTYLLTCSLYATQATAATITWGLDSTAFVPGGLPNPIKTSGGVFLPLISYVYDDGNSQYIAGTYFVNDINGIGVNSSVIFPGDPSPTTIDYFSYIDNFVKEYIQLDMFQIFSYINSNGGISNYELSIEMRNVNGTVDGGWSDALSPPISPSTDLFTMSSSGVHILTLTGANILLHDQYLILTMMNLGESAELFNVKLTDCRVDTCTTSTSTPEPGVIGLLGFSLAGLAVLRWRK